MGINSPVVYFTIITAFLPTAQAQLSKNPLDPMNALDKRRYPKNPSASVPNHRSDVFVYEQRGSPILTALLPFAGYKAAT